MKPFFLSVIALIFIHQVAAQDTNSLLMENMQSLKRSVEVLQYQIQQVEKQERNNQKVLQSLNDSTIRELQKFNQSLKNQSKTIQQASEKQSQQLQSAFEEDRQAQQIRSAIHFILHGAAIILIFFLFFYLKRERENKIEYLIKEAEKHSVQNQDMLKKADELSKIKKSLKKVLKKQKKIKKK